MPDPFERYEAHMRTFRFYIGLTVYANLAFSPVLGLFAGAALFAPHERAILFLIPPAMVSTGFAALSAFAVAEALGLHRAIQAEGRAADLSHITRSAMLPVQTTLTLIFHALIALGLFATVFFTLLNRLP